MPITATPDHVAVAVPRIETAASHWRETLGGGWVAPAVGVEAGGFTARQLRYPGGGKLELIEPRGPDTFTGRYLARFGSGVHHLTLKVPALLPALETVRAAGYDVIDVSTDGELWHEGFLRPSQVGGMIVQLAWVALSDEEWAGRQGATPEPPAEGAATLAGPTLTSADPAAARSLWQLLGAEVVDRDGGLDVSWGDAPLSVRVEPGPRAEAIGLRFEGMEGLQARRDAESAEPRPSSA